MKKSEGERLKYAINESTRAPLARSPFPKGEGKEEAATPQKRKPTPPRCARQPLPREGARVDTPSFLWKGRYEKERGNASQVDDIREHPSAATRFPFPQGEGEEEAASPQKKKANPASLRSAAPSKGRGSRGHSLLPLEGGAPKGRRLDGDSGIPAPKPSPRGEGGERSEPDRAGAV